jgi:hypothetical protein
MDWACGTCEEKENCRQSFDGETSRKGERLAGVGGSIILKQSLRKSGGKLWFGLIWLRIRTTGELL